MSPRAPRMHDDLPVFELKPALAVLHPVQKRLLVAWAPIGGLRIFSETGHGGRIAEWREVEKVGDFHVPGFRQF